MHQVLLGRRPGGIKEFLKSYKSGDDTERKSLLRELKVLKELVRHCES